MKSAAQNGLYWGEFKDAWNARCQRTAAPADREVWRKMLHVRAGAVDRMGCPKSSKDFGQRDIDRWKGVCRAYYMGGNIDAQIEAERQPVKRALVACEWLLNALKIAPDKHEAYIAGIYRNIQRKRVREGARELELWEMPEDDLGLVVAALKHTVEHKIGHDHRHPRTPYASDAARHTHHVGARQEINVTGTGEPDRDPEYVAPENQPF